MMFSIGDIVKDKTYNDYLLIIDNDCAQYIALLLYSDDDAFSGYENNLYRKNYLENFFEKIA